MNFLLPSIGRKVTLARLLRGALERRGGQLIAADCDCYAAGLYAAHERILLPRDDSAEYWPAVEEAFRKYNINCVVPVRLADLVEWARHGQAGQFAPRLLASPLATIELCADKWLLARHFEEHALPHPLTILPETADGFASFPAVAKPKYGAGSQGHITISSRDELLLLRDTNRLDGMIVQEWVEGEEFSVDIYVNLHGQWRTGVVRRRRTVIAGQIDTGETVTDPSLLELSKRIATSASFCGPLNIQVMLTPAGPLIIEINPRFPGGLGLTAAAGVDLAELLVADAHGEEIQPASEYDEMALLGFADGIYIRKRDLLK